MMMGFDYNSKLEEFNCFQNFDDFDKKESNFEVRKG